MKPLFNFLLVALVAVTAAWALPQVLDYTGHAADVVLAASPLVTIMSKELQGNLFRDNEFYKQSTNESTMIQGDTVILPQAGGLPEVQIDRTVLPAPIVQRADGAEDYKIREFTSTPTLLRDSEALIVSYDKRASILADHAATLNEKIADYFANVWSPATATLKTTGDARQASAPGATGTRKAISKDDLIAASTQFNKWEIPLQRRCLVIPAEFQADLLKIPGYTEADKIGKAVYIEGTIGYLMGFNIFVRSHIQAYNAAFAKKAYGAAVVATDNNSALFWHPSFVARAEGNAKVYIDSDKPEYYGSVFSTMARGGGRVKRTDEKGVLALVEDVTA